MKRNIFWPGCRKLPGQVINLLGMEKNGAKNPLGHQVLPSSHAAYPVGYPFGKMIKLHLKTSLIPCPWAIFFSDIESWEQGASLHGFAQCPAEIRTGPLGVSV